MGIMFIQFTAEQRGEILNLYLLQTESCIQVYCGLTFYKYIMGVNIYKPNR